MHGPDTTTAVERLREFARHGSEDAFAAVVRRYLDFVYSIASRRLDGHRQEAEDACQQVFADLARMSRRGDGPLASDEISLGGWLHRHTCFVTANLRRSASRRRHREREAVAMNPSVTHDLPSDEAWRELVPELDEAVQRLPPADRTALLLRFFERCEWRQVGDALGVSADAAQKRVRRALERLRERLVRSGVTLSAVTLGTLLRERTVEASPSELARIVTTRALEAVRTAGSPEPAARPGLRQSMSPWLEGRWGFAAAVFLGLVAVWPVVMKRPAGDSRTPSAGPGPIASPIVAAAAPTGGAAHGKVDPESERTVSERSGGTAGIPTGMRTLSLRLLDAALGRPVAAVPVEIRRWEGTHQVRESFVSSTDGVCPVPVSETTTRLEIFTRSEGFADTRLHWSPERGSRIPESFSVSLDRAISIGGQVLDAEGRAVAGARVDIDHDERAPVADEVISHRFGWIEVETDQAGHWRMNRIAPAMLPWIRGHARHPDHAPSPPLLADDGAPVYAALTNRTHVFRLGTPGQVRGRVIDGGGRGIAGATVALGSLGDPGRRETRTDADGWFSARGGGDQDPLTLTAVAEGFAPTTQLVRRDATHDLIEVVLNPGRTLRLRLVDRDGNGVAGANVWLDTIDHPLPGRARTSEPLVQVDFNPLTDERGGVVWEHAPDRELAFDAHKPGFMRLLQVKVRPDDREHVLVLPPALTIHGTVRDQSSGEPIPSFQVIGGCPIGPWSGTNATRFYWSREEKHRGRFEAGVFRESFEEPVLWGEEETAYVLRIEADDYAPAITRVFRPDEGDVTIAIELRREPAVIVSVVLPDGSPAASAEVAPVTAERRYRIGPEGFDGDPESPVLRTDDEGLFRLVYDDAVTNVLVAHPGGYAAVTPTRLRSSPSLRLQPWGAIEGTVWTRGQPAAARVLTLVSEDWRSMPSLVPDAYRTASDESGRYRFDRLPPGWVRLQVREPTTSREDGAGHGGYSLRGVEIPVGETVTLDLGRHDRTVRLEPKCVAASDEPIRFVTLMTPRPLPPAGIRTNFARLQEWMDRPDVIEATRTGRTYSLARTTDHGWQADGIAPGTYLLRVGLGPSAPGPGAGGASPRVMLTTVTVPEGPAGDPVDFGEIPLTEP